LKGLQRHIRNEKAPAPLTSREEELAELRKHERGSTHVNIDTRHQTLSGVAFPMTEPAHQALRDLAAKVHNYVQLSIGEFVTDFQIFYYMAQNFIIKGCLPLVRKFRIRQK